jgi:hypothetical protein
MAMMRHRGSPPISFGRGKEQNIAASPHCAQWQLGSIAAGEALDLLSLDPRRFRSADEHDFSG